MVVGKAKGARTILNPAPALDYPVDLLRAVDIVLPNEHEAAQLTGLDTSTLEGAQAAANHLVSLGVVCAIITRGGDGAIWATAHGSGSIGVFPVTPIDTVAAGDGFGGVAVGSRSRWPCHDKGRCRALTAYSSRTPRAAEHLIAARLRARQRGGDRPRTA
jgi:ribokinase